MAPSQINCRLLPPIAVAFSASDMPCAWAMLIVMLIKEIKTRDEMRKGKVLENFWENFCIWISLIVVFTCF